jgi:hypothetical protein
MREVPKKSAQELEQDLLQVKGWKFTYWKHYSGDIYQIVDFAFECNTNELMVIYAKMANGYDNIKFTRTLKEWNGTSSTGERRFVMV